MKVLQILTELGVGGAERVCLDLSKELLKAGYEVGVISLKSAPTNKTIENAFKKLEIFPQYLGMDSLKNIFLLHTLRSMIQDFHPDIVHSHLMHPNILSRIACLGLHIPLINTIHISERRKGQGLFFFLDRCTFPISSLCTCVSHASAQFHEKKLGLKQHVIEVVYNGVDIVPSLSRDEIVHFKKQWGVEECTHIFGSIGRLADQKGYERLFPILHELSSQIPSNEQYGVVLIGEGPNRINLEKMAKNLPKNITFVMPGFYENASSLISVFDVFIMPSYYEGYGLAFAEAMTLGVPCVVQNIDSLPELAQKYENSLLVDFDNITESVNTLLQALTYERCKPCIIQTKEQMGKEYMKIYSRFISK
ncbi:MAG TPA: glycosyltransferase [Planctomycetota bacterium]|nr:glycosyltransferase [Planctomycetota bacterium]HRU51141.1 glycosyltransferase [Planctomycetota bacterium]